EASKTPCFSTSSWAIMNPITEPTTPSTTTTLDKNTRRQPQLTFLQSYKDPVGPKHENDHQRIVDENEAAHLFSEGWRYVTTLPSGRLVIQGDSSQTGAMA